MSFDSACRRFPLTCNSTGRFVIERECRGFDLSDIWFTLSSFPPEDDRPDVTCDYVGRFVSLARGIPKK